MDCWRLKQLSFYLNGAPLVRNLPRHSSGGGIHLRDLASEQHGSEETSQRWRAVGVAVSDFTGPRIEPQSSRIDSEVISYYDKLSVGREIMVL